MMHKKLSILFEVGNSNLKFGLHIFFAKRDYSVGLAYFGDA
jgi:hypothetical protein